MVDLKINSDISMTNQSAVIAVVIRDSQANIVRAAAQLVLQTEALVAEALAIRFGLIQAKSLTSGALICESDASLMVKALRCHLRYPAVLGPYPIFIKTAIF